MKVKDLIVKLQEFDPESNVAVSSDEEGNEYYEGIYPEKQNGLLVIYPGGARLDLEEVEGYVPEDEDEE